ncbi:MAG: phosphatase PAP2 family protein [Gemmatimonadaceae bacterium]|nr:phosphatase PAP2 family protein [Chitinophagaceae bacterium]
MEWLDWIESIDKTAFSLMHTGIDHPILDNIMLALRNALVWIPIYIFMLFWALRQGVVTGLKFIVLTLACFAITDYASASVLKPLFGRIRPCYDTDTVSLIRGIIPCGGKLSFPSSHAANHFGLATFWFLTIAKLKAQRWHWLYVWALLIGFAQVYVGKHFPLDILGGSLLGAMVGWALSAAFINWYNFSGKSPSSAINTV